MAYWYACDIVEVIPPEAGSTFHNVPSRRIYPMIYIEGTEAWRVRHVQSDTTRNVNIVEFGNASQIPMGFAFEEDNSVPEVCLIRTDEAIPQSIIDQVNAIGPGGQFLVAIDTVAKRNALYASYPSLQNKFPDQP